MHVYFSDHEAGLVLMEGVTTKVRSKEPGRCRLDDLVPEESFTVVSGTGQLPDEIDELFRQIDAEFDEQVDDVLSPREVELEQGDRIILWPDTGDDVEIYTVRSLG